jgi:subtilisin family serine protease
LERDGAVTSAQPNYLFALQQAGTAPANSKPAESKPAESKPADLGEKLQYLAAKLRLAEAHALAKGDNIPVAVIDSGIDAAHPELAGAVAKSFDTLKSPFKPHAHGTAIAALIAGHAKLAGAAPAARILAVRAFDPAGDSAEATTFNILKGIDWAAANGARVINMSFAGPADPAIHRSLEAAAKKGVVLVAAAGNAGPKSPPLYPAADPNVIAVTATDADDRLFDGANRGRYVAVAAPGVNLIVATPDGGYQVSTGTSYSAAEVSGIAALMIQRRPDLKPAALRAVLLATAKDLGPKGRDDEFGAGLADAYRAVAEEGPLRPVSEATPRR